MTMSLLWYVVAGILLGFAASTLWEWLFFRRKRLKLQDERVRELERKLAEEQAENARMRLAQDAAASPPQSEYESPGVFLDSESPEAASDTADASDSADSMVLAPEVREQPGAQSDVPALSRNSTAAVQPSSNRSVSALQISDSGSLEFEDEPEDDPFSLERLAAELAQGPDESPVTSSSDGRGSVVPRSTDFPDNLSKINGVGDVYKFRLYAAGIYTWHQVAESDVATLRAATNAYPGANVEDWPEQARALAEKHGRQDAYYGGPVPDDLTRIKGIGPVGERTLYRAGICTYDQLAGSAVSELKALFPIAVAGDQPDFASWIRSAIERAKQKAQA